MWAKNPDGTPETAAASLALDNEGNLYVTGSFWGESLTVGDTTLTNVSYSLYEYQSDIFIIKYDPFGNVIWAKSMGGSKSEVGWSIAVDDSDNILLCGWFTSPDAAFDSIVLTSLEDDPNTFGDAYIAKLNTDGNVVWAKSAGTAGYEDISNAITSDQHGNIYVAGSFASSSLVWDSLTLANTSEGFSDIFVIKLDPAGNILWLKGVEGALNDLGRGLTSDPEGNVFVTGSFKSGSLYFGANELANSFPGTGDWFIAKYDSFGNDLWARSAEGNGEEFDWRAVTCDADGNAYATAEFSSYFLEFDDTTFIVNYGDLDLFVVKYTASGEVAWAINAGGAGNDEPLGITLSGTNICLAGTFSEDISFGNNELNNYGGLDFFIANLSSFNVGIGESESYLSTNIFPNPTSDKITVTLFASDQRQFQLLIKLFDLLGREIFSTEEGTISGTFTKQLDISQLSAGSYFLKVLHGGESEMRKMVIEK
jgi:hypothetical protein